MARALAIAFVVLILAAPASAGWIVESINGIGYASGPTNIRVHLTDYAGGAGSLEVSWDNPWAGIDEETGLQLELRCQPGGTLWNLTLWDGADASAEFAMNPGDCPICLGDLDCDGVLDSDDIDKDGDGESNTFDDDRDGDGLDNEVDDDQDGDGIPNDNDLDIDGDGVDNCADADVDGDGDPNSTDDDDDGDGIPDDQDDSPRGPGECGDDDDDDDDDGGGGGGGFPPPGGWNPNDIGPFTPPVVGCPGCVFPFPDEDGDGIPDEDDRDDDNDGIPDWEDDDSGGAGTGETPGEPDVVCATGDACDDGPVFAPNAEGNCGEVPWQGYVAYMYRDDDANGVPDTWQWSAAVAEAKGFTVNANADGEPCCEPGHYEYYTEACDENGNPLPLPDQDEDGIPDEVDPDPSNPQPKPDGCGTCAAGDGRVFGIGEDYDDDGIVNGCDTDMRNCFLSAGGLQFDECMECDDEDDDGECDHCEDGEPCDDCNPCDWLEKIHDILAGEEESGGGSSGQWYGTLDLSNLPSFDASGHMLQIENPSGGTAFDVVTHHVGGWNNVPIVLSPSGAASALGCWVEVWSLLDTMRLIFRTWILAYMVWIFFNKCLGLIFEVFG